MDARSVCGKGPIGCICGCALPADMLVVVMTQPASMLPPTFHLTGHTVIESLEPGENWRWCYVDEILVASEIDENDTPFERESVMSNDTLALDGAAKNGKFSRQSLPLVGDISANGRSGGMFKSICQRVRRCNKKHLEPTIELAVENAREGREARRIGTHL